MSTTNGTSTSSDRTEAETEDTGEQKNTEDNQVENELHDEAEKGRSELFCGRILRIHKFTQSHHCLPFPKRPEPKLTLWE